jgi:hypothetical protein
VDDSRKSAYRLVFFSESQFQVICILDSFAPFCGYPIKIRAEKATGYTAAIIEYRSVVNMHPKNFYGAYSYLFFIGHS